TEPTTEQGLRHNECAFKAAICEETARVCAERFGKELRAIVLSGSVARDEAIVVGEGARHKLLGDADIGLVFHDGVKQPDSTVLASASQELERGLLGIGLASEIGLSAIDGRYLATLPRHIFTYELRTHGLVIWGDR